jgi:hypothetical protein
VAHAATCGTFDDGCSTLDCGACTTTASCQKIDGGFSCQAGECTDDPQPTTCNGVCNDQTNNCGKIVPCGPQCPGQLCGGGATASTCGCPAPQLTLMEYVSNNGYHCYGTDASQCPIYTPTVPVLRLYDNAYGSELVPVYRCTVVFQTGPAFLVTTDPGCEGGKGGTFVNEGPLGYALAPGAASKCGAVPIHRYEDDSLEDFAVSKGAAPSADYRPMTDLGLAW